jgi:metallo-beta-lactamase class B
MSLLFLLLLPAAVLAADTKSCSSCAAWNEPQQPFRIFGNTYYVGMKGLSAILITSQQGHVLIDGALAQSAPEIAKHVRALGFRVEDIKLILNSHVHYDHAGGISALQWQSEARVAASPWSAGVLKSGKVARDDPQFGVIDGITPVGNVRVIKDGEVLHAGTLAVTAHFTPGHTPGGTSWSWKACEGKVCYNIVYADSLTAVSADGFKFSNKKWARDGFAKSFAVLESLQCDILLTPHPDFSGLFAKYETRPAKGVAHDAAACKTFAASMRTAYEKRLEAEKKSAK